MNALDIHSLLDSEYDTIGSKLVVENHVIQKRKGEIKRLSRWTIPALIDKCEQIYSIAITCTLGHGRSTFSRAFAVSLRAFIEKHPIINKDYSVVWIDMNGNINGISGEKTIVIMDGIPLNKNIDQIRIIVQNAPTIAFVEKSEELTKFIERECLKDSLMPLTANDILDILKTKNVQYTKQVSNSYVRKINSLLTKGVKPVSIIESFYISSVILTPNISIDLNETQKKSAPVSIILDNHSTINTIDSIPIKDLRDYIHSRIVGQEKAIDDVVSAVSVAKFGLNDENRPYMVSMFMGPTGVGKTELTKVLSQALLGSDKEIIRLDMSEFSMPHSIEKLFGSPPGYVGHETDTYFISQLKKKKTGIILFDEIEKANDTVIKSLLSALDDGRITSSKGQVFSITKFFIIMTTNILVNQLGKTQVGFGGQSYASMDPRSLLKEKSDLPPEFLNRIDNIILFTSLSKQHAIIIIQRMASDLIKSLERKTGISLTISRNVYEEISEVYDKDFGGRDIRRHIDKLKRLCANYIANNPDCKKITIHDMDKISQ